MYDLCLLRLSVQKVVQLFLFYEDLHCEISLDGIHREFQTIRPASVGPTRNFFSTLTPYFNPKEWSNDYFHTLKMHQKGVMGDTSSFWEL